MKLEPYLYVVVRKDLSTPQKAVQSMHAVFESVLSFPPKPPYIHPNVVFCEVKDERRLFKFSQKLEKEGIRYVLFQEPDIGNQYTALATETVVECRSVFKELQLVKEKSMSKEEVGQVLPIIEKETYKTRFGYVAYSYEDYLKLKRLNRLFYEDCKRAARWKRWVRKAPHNRVLKKWLRNDLGQRIGVEIVGSMPEPVTWDLFSTKLVNIDRKPIGRWFEGYIRTDNTVEVEYQKARHPQRSPGEVESPGLTTATIDGLLAQAERHSAV